MKKVVSIVLALAAVVALLAGMSVVTYADSDIEYSEHMQGASEYDLTGSVIFWVKQATGALVWVPADDARSDDEIIDQAKNADPSLANATKKFEVLKGEGIKYTPNTNGSKAKVTVSSEAGVMKVYIDGNYSHFVKGTSDSASAAASANTNNSGAAAGAATGEAAGTVTGEAATIRIDAPRKMAVKFEDGSVYYGGEMKEIEVGKEYLFQMCTVNWENGIYDENGNGICGTVVYRMKAVHNKEFLELKAAAAADPDRYTVKGIDIIDNEAKMIIVNCDASDSHLETDVNNFFMAYRFHFAKGDYNKQTGIDNVLSTPVESLSVNLPLGTTVTCKAYINYQFAESADILVSNNSGEGVYESELLTSVNDYTWNY